MGRRYDTLVKSTQIRKLIEENKYVKALEMLESLDFSRNYMVSDLYLFAKAYLKADRFNEANSIYHQIYEKTHTKRALKECILMALRMDEIKEAKEYFLEYELSGEATLDLYELRYRLAKAEGVSRNELIQILENLRKEEFTEEWGFQLAKLYEMQGNREKCIEVCSDIILWFGTGAIVEKSKELKKLCEEAESLPVTDEEIPEPIEPDREEDVPEPAEPDREDGVTDLIKPDREKDVPEPMEPEVKNGVTDLMESETEKNVPKPMRNPEEILEPIKSDRKKEVLEPTKPDVTIKIPISPAKKVRPKKAEIKSDKTVREEIRKPLNAEPVGAYIIDEENIYLSDNGFSYFTLKDTILQLKNGSDRKNFIITGGEDRIVVAVAKKILKQLAAIGYYKAGNFAEIDAEKLNRIKLDDWMNKLIGGGLLILNAQNISPKAKTQLIGVMEKHEGNLVVLLSGEFDELDSWLNYHRDIESSFYYKVKL